MDNFTKYISTHILSFFGFTSALWWIIYYLKTILTHSFFSHSYFMHPVTLSIPLGMQAIISVLILALVVIEYLVRIKDNNKYEIQIKNKAHNYILKTGIFFFILPMFLVGILLLMSPLLFFFMNKISIYVFFAVFIIAIAWLATITIQQS